MWRRYLLQLLCSFILLLLSQAVTICTSFHRSLASCPTGCAIIIFLPVSTMPTKNDGYETMTADHLHIFPPILSIFCISCCICLLVRALQHHCNDCRGVRSTATANFPSCLLTNAAYHRSAYFCPPASHAPASEPRTTSFFVPRNKAH